MSDAAGAARSVEGWLDTHCHIQPPYSPEGIDPPEVLKEAGDSGVSGLVCVGTDASTSSSALELVSGLRAMQPGFGLWATVGLHPHEASRGTDEVEELLARAVAELPGIVVAVGECGLDYHYDHSPRDVQRSAFARQIALAKEHGLALVVHARDAWDDILDLLCTEGAPERIVMHCFTGGKEEARRCLDLGAHLSFSGIVTFKGAEDVREAAAFCPEDRILVETDAPFLSPVPHRGKPNRPAWVAIVGATVAALRGVPPRDLAASSSEAAVRALGLRPL